MTITSSSAAATPILSVVNAENHIDADAAVKFASHNKSYALGVRGSNDSFNIAYKDGTDADLDDTVLVNITSSGNVTTTGTLTAATGSTVGNLTLANGSITDSSGAISFGNENLSTTGTLASWCSFCHWYRCLFINNKCCYWIYGRHSYTCQWKHYR